MRAVAIAAGLLITLALAFGFGASAPAVNDSWVGRAQPSHSLKLGPFVTPPTRTSGLVASVRINGGPPLRLLLDSGTQYVVLDRKAAVTSGCSGGSNLDLVGTGARSVAIVKKLSAATLDIGDLRLRNLPVLVADHTMADGIHGAPLSIFAAFLIRLDIPRKRLDLLPYPPGPADTTGALKTLSSNHLLFVKGTVNETVEGYFLLDTGASYTAISQNTARRLNLPRALAPQISLVGGTAEMDAPLLDDRVRMRLGTMELRAGSVVAVDLSMAGRYHQFEVAGLIGYPALHESVLIVNYRDGFVRIDSR